MHAIMVKSLPPQCHLTAIFDVRTINNLIYCNIRVHWQCVYLQSCHSGTVLGACFFNSCGLLTMTYNIPRSSPYCMPTPFQTAPSRLTYTAQYRSDGVVKQFRHPYRLEVLREKESKAVAVSAIFLSGNLCPIIVHRFHWVPVRIIRGLERLT